ncbi:MAG: rhomboid family intramembrane serine protease [Candidatus Acidiferrum sp.]
MLFPIKHENMTARRWPLVTIGLILVNTLVFLCTHQLMEDQEDPLVSAKVQVLTFAAQHPELTVPPKAQQFVTDYQRYYPANWAELQTPNDKANESEDSQIESPDGRQQLQAEMDSLGTEYSKLAAASITERYAFIPAHPKLIAYISSTFLHGGWLHLIFNMWFLWLAGFVLEDVWGRPLYLVFYLVAGIAATQLDAWASPMSMGHSLGASGAIAGLMGAFLIRFPKLRIRLVWIFDFGLLGFWPLWVRAYWLLPVWAGMEIYYEKAFGQSDGVAHWAHVGGFIFGALGALALRYSGLERKANKAIEEKIAWTTDPEFLQANDLIENGKLDEAALILNKYLEERPDSLGAWNMLRAIHWQRNEIPACRDVSGKLCALNVGARMYEAAWLDYEEFLNLGGHKMPPAVWLELCRVPEERGDYRRALNEYERLAAAHPTERQELLAQLAAARILLTRLNRPDEALRLYEAASASTVPHLDLEREIESGIREAKRALTKTALTVP